MTLTKEEVQELLVELKSNLNGEYAKKTEIEKLLSDYKVTLKSEIDASIAAKIKKEWNVYYKWLGVTGLAGILFLAGIAWKTAEQTATMIVNTALNEEEIKRLITELNQKAKSLDELLKTAKTSRTDLEQSIKDSNSTSAELKEVLSHTNAQNAAQAATLLKTVKEHDGDFLKLIAQHDKRIEGFVSVADDSEFLAIVKANNFLVSEKKPKLLGVTGEGTLDAKLLINGVEVFPKK